MPFIACLNNVRTTHTPTQPTHTQKTTTNPHHNQGERLAFTQSMQPIPKEQGEQPDHTYKLIKRIALDNTTPGPTPSRRQCTSISRVARCSRPLCRSQTTTPPTPSHTSPTPKQTGNQDHTCAQAKEEPEQPPNTELDSLEPGRLILQDPTVCLTPSPTNARQQVTTTPPSKLGQKRDRRRFH